ncbi:hypothetical protein BGZ83_005516 [Gryganskiella cystojenkinii]|nr:hypothetical protein BGZ83_005516 [Gryganskiella cystojenkinii]
MSASEFTAVLQDILSGSTRTDSRLEAVAKRLQTDADFRVEIGDVESIWTDLSDIFANVAVNGLNPDQVEQLMILFRTVRNSVAGVPSNQDRARIANIPQRIQDVVSQAAHTHYGNMEYMTILRAGVQALSNLLTGNDASKDSIWRSLLVESPSASCDSNLLSVLPSDHYLPCSTLAAIGDETILLSTVMLCYNCIYQSPERSQILLSTSSGRRLIRQLIVESQASSGQEERKSFEMIYTFFDHLIDESNFHRLFEAASENEEDEDHRIRYHGDDSHKAEARDVESSISNLQGLKIEEIRDDEDDHAYKSGKGEQRHLTCIVSEQVTLLKLIDSRIFTHHRRHQDLSQSSESFARDQPGPAISLDTVRFLTKIFADISELTIGILQTLDKPGVGQHGVEELSNLSEAVTLLLGCFSHLSLYEDGQIEQTSLDANHGDHAEGIEGPGKLITTPEWFKAQHLAMVQGNLVENAIELLRQADVSLVRVTKPATAKPEASDGMTANSDSTLLSNTSTEKGSQSFFSGLKRDIVRVVGNLSYCSRNVQDRIRGCNGLIVMLSQCNIDDANPYLREYAILAMKNILAGNAENQALIEELQPIEAVDHPALQEARVRAHLDANTGRPVLSQIKK